MKRYLLVDVAVLSTATTTLEAASRTSGLVAAHTHRSFEQHAREIRAGMAGSDRFSAISSTDCAAV